MATLNFAGTDRKVFTPVSSALGALSNGPGTIIVFAHWTATGAADLAGLTDSGPVNYYHYLEATSTALSDDENHTGPVSGAFTQDTSNWWWLAVDWASTAVAERFHWRNHTSGGAWTHSAGGTGPAAFAGPGTSGWVRIGSGGDHTTGSRDMAVAAIWAGTQFSDTDYGTWSKTSDLYTHALGAPTFLCELNATTLADLIGGATYSSANSSGTALTGGDPPSFTFDGVGGAAALVMPPAFNAIPFMGGVI